MGNTHAQNLHEVVAQLATALTQRGWMLATAESCTGGMIAAACTDLPGSSAWFDRGFVTYSNAAKTDMLGVPAALIKQHGAVSEQVVHAMVQGATKNSAAHTAIAVTGIAGPDGGSPHKPVGTVWVGWQIGPETYTECMQFAGDRAAVRLQTVGYALQQLHLRIV